MGEAKIYNYIGKTKSPLSVMSESRREMLQSCIFRRDHVCLVGPTGSGKSSIIRDLVPDGIKLTRIDCSIGVDEDIIVGRLQIMDDKTVWVDGMLTDAVRHGHWLIFEEINGLKAGVKLAMQALLEKSTSYFKITTTGESVPIHPNFRFFATKNPTTLLYAGTSRENIASNDRWIILNVGYMSPESEVDFLKDYYGVTETRPGFAIMKDCLSKLCEVVASLRKSHMSGDLEYPITTRKLMQIIEKAHHFSIAIVLKELIGGYCEADENSKQQVIDSFRNYITPGGDLENAFLKHGRLLNRIDGNLVSNSVKFTEFIQSLKTRKFEDYSKSYKTPSESMVGKGDKFNFFDFAYSYPVEVIHADRGVSVHDWQEYIYTCDILERHKIKPAWAK